MNFRFCIVLSLLIFSIISCETEEEESKGKELFNYFSNNYSEREFTFSSGNGFYITLPLNYTVSAYQQFSLTNEDNFRNKDNTTFFSVDQINKDDIGYYEKFFTDSLENKSKDKLELMLNYVLNSRASDLEIYTTSVITELTTNKGIEMKIAAVKGSKNSYSNPMYYQYSIFQMGEELFLLQFITNEEDISFFHEDILTVFKSVRES